MISNSYAEKRNLGGDKACKLRSYLRRTVYNDDRLVYSLKDGTEITVML